MRRVFYPILFLLCFVASQAWATTYYVNKSGSDANSCATAQSSTPANGKLTIAGGIGCLSGGDTLLIRSGTYAETIQYPTVNIPSGTVSQPTTIQTYPGDSITLNGSGEYILWIRSRSDIIIDGLDRSLTLSGVNTTRGVVRIEDAPRVTIQNAKLKDTTSPTAITGTCFTMASQSQSASTGVKLINNEVGNCGTAIGTGHGVYLSFCASCLIERNYIHDAANFGVHNFSSYFINNNNIIRYNYIYNNKSTGMLLGAGSGTIADHNIISNNATVSTGGGIRIQYTSPTNMQVYNNTIYNNTGPCIYVGAGSVDTKLKNNYCLSNTSNIISDSGTNTTGACGDNGNLCNTTTANLVDPANAEFTPSAGSPVIDAGTDVSLPYDGTAPNIGALSSPRLSACEVGSVDATSLIGTWTNNVGAPILPASGITGLVIEEDTGGGFNPVTVSSTARTGTNSTDSTLGSSITGGSSVRLSTSSSNLTNSQLIGNSLNGTLPDVSAVTCTNNVGGGGPSYTITQAAAQLYNASLENGALVALASAETIPPDGVVLVGTQLDFTAADVPIRSYKWTVDKNSGGFNDLTDTCAAGGACFFGISGGSSSFPADQFALSSCLSAGGLTEYAGAVLRTSAALPNYGGSGSQDHCAPLGALVRINGATKGDVFTFRLEEDTGTETVVHTIEPRFTIGNDQSRLQ